MNLIDHLSDQEQAIMLATNLSEDAKTLVELAASAQMDLTCAHHAVDALIEKGILKPVESYDTIVVYAYTQTQASQRVYDELHGTRSH